MDLKVPVFLMCSLLVSALEATEINKTEMSKKVTEELLQLEKDFQNAIIQNDVEAIARFIADDWVIVDGDGGIISKDQFLEITRSGTLKHTDMKLEEPRVRVYGETAVVTGRATSAGTYMGNVFTTLERSTDVFVKIGGRWVCVLTQLTRLAANKNH